MKDKKIQKFLETKFRQNQIVIVKTRGDKKGLIKGVHSRFDHDTDEKYNIYSVFLFSNKKYLEIKEKDLKEAK